MAWTQSDLDKLNAAIARGVRRVAYQTGSIEYNSLDDMLRLRELMTTEVAGKPLVSRTVGHYSSGLAVGPQFPDRWR